MIYNRDIWQNIISFLDSISQISLVSSCKFFYHNLCVTKLINLTKYQREGITVNILKQRKYSNLVLLDLSDNILVNDITFLKNLKYLKACGPFCSINETAIEGLKLNKLITQKNQNFPVLYREIARINRIDLSNKRPFILLHSFDDDIAIDIVNETGCVDIYQISSRETNIGKKIELSDIPHIFEYTTYGMNKNTPVLIVDVENYILSHDNFRSLLYQAYFRVFLIMRVDDVKNIPPEIRNNFEYSFYSHASVIEPKYHEIEILLNKIPKSYYIVVNRTLEDPIYEGINYYHRIDNDRIEIKISDYINQLF